MQYNADVKAVDADGRTALAYARSVGADDCAKVLLTNGCPEDHELNINNSALRRPTPHGRGPVIDKLQASVI